MLTRRQRHKRKQIQGDNQKQVSNHPFILVPTALANG